jgi:hypothetical protein
VVDTTEVTLSLAILCPGADIGHNIANMARSRWPSVSLTLPSCLLDHTVAMGLKGAYGSQLLLGTDGPRPTQHKGRCAMDTCHTRVQRKGGGVNGRPHPCFDVARERSSEGGATVRRLCEGRQRPAQHPQRCSPHDLLTWEKLRGEPR